MSNRKELIRPTIWFCRWLLLAIACWGSLSCASTSGRWRIVSQSLIVGESDILDLHFISSKHGYALTATQLLETHNEGINWTAKLKPDSTSVSFSSFAFANNRLGIITGRRASNSQDNVILWRTEDGGESWQDVYLNGQTSRLLNDRKGFNAICFSNEQIGWVVGEGMIIHTNDGGKTWEVNWVMEQSRISD